MFYLAQSDSPWTFMAFPRLGLLWSWQWRDALLVNQRAPHVTVFYFTQQMRQSKLRFQSCLSLTIGSRRAMRTSVRHTLDRYFPSGARIWRCTKMYLIAQKMNTTNVNQNSLVSWGFFRTIKNLALFLHSYGCRKLDSNLQWPDHVTSQQDHKVIIDFCEKVCD